MITERDINILKALWLFGYLVRGQIGALFFPTDDGSLCRTRLRLLVAAGLVKKRRAEVANPHSSNTVPVYHITQKGIEYLASARDDPSLLNHCAPDGRAWQNFKHWVTVSEVMLKLRAAVSRQQRVKLHRMFFEHTVVNAEAEDPAKRYKLYTVLQEKPRLVCAADAAWEVEVDGLRCAMYLELERETTHSVARTAARKCPGFYGMWEAKKWQRHFPQATQMRVLAVSLGPGFRDGLRKEIKKLPFPVKETEDGKEKGVDIWRFCALSDLTEESFLHGDIFYKVDGNARPLIQPEGPPQR